MNRKQKQYVVQKQKRGFTRTPTLHLTSTDMVTVGEQTHQSCHLQKRSMLVSGFTRTPTLPPRSVPPSLVKETIHRRGHLKSRSMLVCGFTLIEVLVAIAILLTAIVAPLQIISKATTLGARSKDEVVASFLAQDAIEFVRYKIITNRNRMNSGVSGAALLDGLADCVDPKVCRINTDIGTIVECTPGGVCPALQWDWSRLVFGYGEFGLPSDPVDFNRKLTISPKDGPAHGTLSPSDQTEFVVTATTTWGKLNENQTTVSESVIDWRIILP